MAGKRYPTADEQREWCRADIERAAVAGIVTFRFRASNMAAGPCPKAARLDERRVSLGDIELVPFPECTHPDQCGCLWQAWASIIDELGP